MELPYKGNEDYESEIVSAFGYMQINSKGINKYIIARRFRDFCNNECACDLDYYNPAFLMCNNDFYQQTFKFLKI